MDKIKTIRKPRIVEQLCEDAQIELMEAVAYYPEWPTVLHPVIEEVQAQLERARANNESSNCTAHSIFGEEYMEFLEAALIGNKELARRELVQAIAMLLRIGCHLDDYVSLGLTEALSKEVSDGK
jgi:hypothetical protein